MCIEMESSVSWMSYDKMWGRKCISIFCVVAIWCSGKCLLLEFSRGNWYILSITYISELSSLYAWCGDYFYISVFKITSNADKYMFLSKNKMQILTIFKLILNPFSTNPIKIYSQIYIKNNKQSGGSFFVFFFSEPSTFLINSKNTNTKKTPSLMLCWWMMKSNESDKNALNLQWLQTHICYILIMKTHWNQ